MNISKYESYFHDGSVISIHHVNSKIEFTLSSAEIDPDIMKDNIPISSDDTLKGKLHVVGVNNIQINKRSFTGNLKLNCDNGKIFDLVIQEQKLKISFEWHNYKPRPPTDEFSNVEIIAEKIYWEPLPELIEPFT